MFQAAKPSYVLYVFHKQNLCRSNNIFFDDWLCSRFRKATFVWVYFDFLPNRSFLHLETLNAKDTPRVNFNRGDSSNFAKVDQTFEMKSQHSLKSQYSSPKHTHRLNYGINNFQIIHVCQKDGLLPSMCFRFELCLCLWTVTKPS